MQSVKDKVVARIYGKGRGSSFTAKDFLDLGRRDSIDSALSQLKKIKLIRPVLRGVYDYPRFNEDLGGEISPDVDQIAQAVARKHGWTVQASGAMAANLIGISQQVPAQVVYFSDGPSRAFELGLQTVRFKHAEPKSMQVKHRTSALVLQALRYLGQTNVDERVVGKIRNRLSEVDKKRLAKDLRYTTDWIYDATKRIVGESEV